MDGHRNTYDGRNPQMVVLALRWGPDAADLEDHLITFFWMMYYLHQAYVFE
jgi:hypothetical protein